MRIGMTSLGMGASSLDDVLATAKSAGCEAMELNGKETVHHSLWAPPIDYEDIQDRIVKSGVVATSLGGYCDFAQTSDGAIDEQARLFVGYCELARRMDIPVVRAFAGDVVEGHTLDEFYPRMVRAFKEITSQIAGWGIKVGIENHGRLINDGDALHSLITEVGSPVLGMTLDTGNFCWAGHTLDDAHRFFEKLAPLTVSVHIKDGRFVDGEFVFVPAGRGDLDLVGVFQALLAAGYQGPVVSEFEGAGDYHQGTLESVAYLRGLRDALA